MSRIFGILNLADEPVSPHDLAVMSSLLARRGPDDANLWSRSNAGIGHTRLTSAPEPAIERQPVVHAAAGCVITADARLDNRDELLRRLDLTDRSGTIGDAGLILEAYLEWGHACPEHLLGDFSFAIWDPTRRALFCARDHFGMRPFYYHHAPGSHFIFASEPRAIVALSQVPYQINEGRVADFLVPALQWIDYTSTFFEQVFRLPPATSLTVTPAALNRRQYWTLEPGPELRLSSDDAYAEAMRDVLTTAVESRLRGGPVGATLSGGLDSGSVVAVAREVHAGRTSNPFPTFSGVGPEREACVETAAIHAGLTMGGIRANLVDYSKIGDLIPRLEQLTWGADEPFDASMVLLSALYLTAHQQGMRVMLDGAGGDVVLNEGTHVMRLWRQGRWTTALTEASRLEHFHTGTAPTRHAFRGARAALTPEVARRAGRRLLAPRTAAAFVRQSIISPEFAQRISLVERVRTLTATQRGVSGGDYLQEVAAAIHPNITAGRERYERVASTVGVEARDPFLDRRVVEFCVTLPGAQRLHDGWPKVILRRAMAGRLPDSVRWRRGKQHLGWSFRTGLLDAGAEGIREQQQELLQAIRPFVRLTEVESAFHGYFGGDASQVEPVLIATTLARWLISAAARPVAVRSRSC